MDEDLASNTVLDRGFRERLAARAALSASEEARMRGDDAQRTGCGPTFSRRSECRPDHPLWAIWVRPASPTRCTRSGSWQPSSVLTARSPAPAAAAPRGGEVPKDRDRAGTHFLQLPPDHHGDPLTLARWHESTKTSTCHMATRLHRGFRLGLESPGKRIPGKELV